MLFQGFDIFQSLADIIGAILNVLKPIVSPIGAWMVNWIEVALSVFPTDSLSLYILIFIILIVSGGLINSLWHGDEPPKYFHKAYYEEISDEKMDKLDEDLKAMAIDEEIDEREIVELKDEEQN